MIVKDALNMNVWLKLARIVDLSHILAKECRFDFFLAYYRIYIIELYQICFRTFSKNADPCCPSPLYQGYMFCLFRYSHGLRVRPWDISWYHENSHHETTRPSRGGGAKSFIMRTSHGIMRNLRVSPWDFSLYHEMFSWWMFLLPHPPPREGLVVSGWEFSLYREISHGFTMRILMVPWDISWSHHETLRVS